MVSTRKLPSYQKKYCEESLKKKTKQNKKCISLLGHNICLHSFTIKSITHFRVHLTFTEPFFVWIKLFWPFKSHSSRRQMSHTRLPTRLRLKKLKMQYPYNTPSKTPSVFVTIVPQSHEKSWRSAKTKNKSGKRSSCPHVTTHALASL